jgi:hypothetical protein
MDRAKSTRQRIPGPALAILLLACAACAGPRAAEPDMLETVCLCDDGLRLLLASDGPAGERVAGADVSWDGTDVHIRLVRVAAGQDIALSHPSYVHPNGRRYVFIPCDHVPEGSWIWEYVDQGRGPEKLGAWLWKGDATANNRLGSPGWDERTSWQPITSCVRGDGGR